MIRLLPEFLALLAIVGGGGLVTLKVLGDRQRRRIERDTAEERQKAIEKAEYEADAHAFDRIMRELGRKKPSDEI